MFDMVPAAMNYLKSSPPKMRVLAVANDKRLPLLPDVPTFAELGIKDMVVSNWLGVVAPKGTPNSIIETLNKAINKALVDPDFSQRITSSGNIVIGGDPTKFAEFIKSETSRWSKLINDKGITSD